jgi:hypothetical protein
MTKDEILKAYQAFCRERVYVCAYCDHCLDEPELEEWISLAIDRYAMHIVEQSVPESKGWNELDHIAGVGEAKGHNLARQATLSKARQLTNRHGMLS